MRVIYLNKVQADGHLPAVNFSLFNAYGLAQAGAETFLFLQKADPHFRPEMLLQDFDLPPLENLHIFLLPKQRKFGIRTNQWFYLETQHRIQVLHRGAPVDAVISRDPGALPFLVYLRRKTGIPVFYQPHNFYLDLSLQPEMNRKNARKYHWLEKTFIPRLNAVLCLQESQAAWYRKHLPRPPVLVAKPGLVHLAQADSNRFSLKTIGYVGSLQLQKGVQTLLRAFAALNEPDCRLLLIGGRNEGEIAPVRRLVAELGVCDRVEMPGWLPYVQVRERLSTVSVGALPLQDNFYNRYLTAPNKLFDYLSFGIPIAASDLPAIHDFITPDVEGKMVPPGNPKALARRLHEFLSDRQMYQTCSARAWQTARRSLWKDRGEELLHLLKATSHTD